MTILLTINLILLIWLVVVDMCEWYEWEYLHYHRDRCSQWIKDAGDTLSHAWNWFLLCSAINLFILITEGWV
jgi:hypothetical protein